jgi:acyl-CoA thioesterase-1
MMTVQAASQTLVILGDSLSEGYGVARDQSWAVLLAHHLKTACPQVTLINSSVSGDTTRNGVNRLNSVLNQTHPTWVVIALGANDGLRGLSLDNTEKQLKTLIDLTRQAHAIPILAEMAIPPNYGPRYADAFTAVYQNLHQQEKVALIPFILKNIAIKPELMQADGLHPNANAQPMIAEIMWMSLHPLLACTKK